MTSFLNLKAVVGFASLVGHGHNWLAVCVASLHQLQEVIGTGVLVQVLDAIPTLWSLARPLVLLRIGYYNPLDKLPNLSIWWHFQGHVVTGGNHHHLRRPV